MAVLYHGSFVLASHEVVRGSRIEVMLLVALHTGMRRGELFALRWDDIDFENELIFVRRTVNYVGVSVTMDTYSHVLPSMHQNVARKLDDMFGDA